MQGKLGYSLGQFSASLFAHYVDRQYALWRWTTQVNQYQRLGEPAPAYVSLGANLRYDYPAWRGYINLHGANLLGADIRYAANELVDFRGGGFGPGRTVLLTVGYAP